jgi:sec-independent protein translocase protein TatA
MGSPTAPELRCYNHGTEEHAMGSLGLPELIIILIIIILIFGANRLPEIGRGIGKGIRNFKDATRDSSNESKP